MSGAHRFERLAPEGAERAHALVAACGAWLKQRYRLAHWDPPYPLASMRAEAAERGLWLLVDGDRDLATFTVGDAPLYPYPDGAFAVPRRALYLNRLAVDPAAQRRGLGARCMAEVERLARAESCASVRFDAIAAHPPLLAFYLALGYRSGLSFELKPGLLVTCFEKWLDVV